MVLWKPAWLGLTEAGPGRAACQWVNPLGLGASASPALAGALDVELNGWVCPGGESNNNTRRFQAPDSDTIPIISIAIPVANIEASQLDEAQKILTGKDYQ